MPNATNDDREPGLRTATLKDVAARPLPRGESITAVIRHSLRPDAIPAYEAWLKQIVPIAKRFPGHRGVHVIHPAPGSMLYTITIRFDSLFHAQDWLVSAARQELLQEVLPLLESEEEIETRSGLEFWFHPAAGQKQARRYKQFLVTLAVIFPLTMIVPRLVRIVSDAMPFLRNTWSEHLASAAIVVALMTYVLMPRITSLLAGWLYRR
ncbi:antibiotic biosynthesis monooxygenase [Variovorax sp. dw_308]|uniref:antibiotic biosynthesis monooxygenase n=1 Tax=Variovorax sp. dw_308 TaxID=2721546 RepID=UPI001C45F9AD|nr:antibiotic biosynthesis monooxygenase [Variovorax sp. dw_308]